jgi:hypothetical protein
MPKPKNLAAAVKAVQKVKKAETAVKKAVTGRGKYKSTAPKRAHGRGGYWSDLGNKFLDFGGKALNTVVDRGLNSLMSFALGGGKYKIKKNSILASHLAGRGFYHNGAPGGAPFTSGPPGGMPLTGSTESGFLTNSAPTFASKQNSGSDIIVSHREYIMDIMSSTSFSTTTLPVNPGNGTMFPWMSQLANLYEEYEMLGLVFEFKTMSATAVGTTSSAMGAVVMATDYDCEDANYSNKRQMEAEEYSCSDVPFQTFFHPVECARQRNVLPMLYVEPGITASSQAPGDPRFSVLGNFTIATQGQQTGGQAIGELWVSYHVKLSRPILEVSAPSASAYSAHFSCLLSTSGVPSATAVTTNDPSRLTFTASGTSTTTAGLVIGLNIPADAGDYLVVQRAVQSGTTAWATPSPAGFSGHNAALLQNITYSSAAPPVADSYPAAGAAADTATTWDGTNVCAVWYNIVSLSSGGYFGLPLFCQSNNVSGVDVFVTSWNTSVITNRRRRRRLAGSYDTRIDKLEQMMQSLAHVSVDTKDEQDVEDAQSADDFKEMTPSYESSAAAAVNAPRSAPSSHKKKTLNAAAGG